MENGSLAPPTSGSAHKELSSEKSVKSKEPIEEKSEKKKLLSDKKEKWLFDNEVFID